ncbi:MAG: hypothetical protein MUP85_25615, partial [Candidatus Lokiarchaeota archaeon]|nr:hypothetical protein [Candidatus Lokiarchaeota archaeon]
MKKSIPIIFLITIIFFVNAYPQNKLPIEKERGRFGGPPGLSKNFALILHKHEDINNINLTRDFIQGHGGAISIMSDSHAMVGWISPEIVIDLIGKNGIESIHYRPFALNSLAYKDKGTRFIVEYYNSVISGEMEGSSYSEWEKGSPLINDVFEPSIINPENFFKNLEDKNINLEREFSILEQSGVLSPGYSDILQGTIACCLFFIESNGSIDGNSYSWTESAWGHVYNQCLDGLNWWSYQANRRGISVTFNLYYYKPDLGVMQQGYEPIFHSSSDDYLWINQIMSNLGFNYGSKWDRVEAFNAYLKNYAGTQWAYSCFIAYNPPNENAPDRFTNNTFAYAYYGGPYIQMLYKNDNWSLYDTWGTFAHETGHIFWACDEYYQEGYGGCTSCAPCNNYRPVYNGNCEHPGCNPWGGVSCIMRHQGNAVCSYTAEQVGWSITRYQLEVISGAGGTTNPSPGFYTYSGGDEVTVEAIPETYNCFYKWGEAYQGNENPIIITMNANKKIFADFRYIHEPIGVSGE